MNIKYTIQWTLLIGLFFIQACYGQKDTIDIRKELSLNIWKFQGKIYSQDGYILSSKIIRTGPNKDLFHYLMSSEKQFDKLVKFDFDTYSTKYPINLGIFFCTIFQDSVEVESGGWRSFTNHYINYLLIQDSKFEDEFQLTLNTDEGCTFKDVDFNKHSVKSSSTNITYSECVFKDTISICCSKIPTFRAIDCKSNRNNIAFDIRSCTLGKEFYISCNPNHGVSSFFTKDSIRGSVHIIDKSDIKTNHKKAIYLNFKDCYIDAQFFAKEINKPSKIIFDNCTFGPKMILSELDFDVIIFKNCQIINNPIYLTFADPNKAYYVSFPNSNIANIKFDYTENVHLITDTALAKLSGTANFELLLDKFDQEHKQYSYKNVDLEFSKYKLKNASFLPRLGYRINELWWNYGYNKNRILWWTLFFGSIFFILNLIFWNKMKEFYPIIESYEKRNNYTRKHRFFHDALLVLIFTAYIFFTIRINFDKLKHTNSLMLIYFFSQYIMGLICLFFIFNYLLKI